MSKSNMYPEYEGKTLNFIGGECPYGCSYCYVKSLHYSRERYTGKPYLIDKTFSKPLGKNKQWFICSCSDVCAVSKLWFKKILKHLNTEPSNTYLIQSKNPTCFNEFIGLFPPKTILGTTAETNRDYKLSKSPQPADRLVDLAYCGVEIPKMVSIEPIMDFDLDEFVKFIGYVRPIYVSIGADSKGHKLPEPTPEKITNLITELKNFTVVKIKDNLKRIMEGHR